MLFFSNILLGLYIAAHLLVLISLFAFGLRTDGWVLHPLALTWQAFFVGGSLLLLRERAGQLVIPPLLLLAGVAAFAVTGLLGAEYAPYDLFEQHEIFVWLNVLLGIVMSVLALLYRWPRLLFIWAYTQGILLVSYPVWWIVLWRWGELGAPVQVAAVGLFLPLLYLLTSRALGIRVPTSFPLSLSFALLLPLLVAARHAIYLEANFPPSFATKSWQAFAVTIPFMMAFGAFLLPMPLLFRRHLPIAVKRRLPWEVLALLLLSMTSLSLSYLQVTNEGHGGLPPAGQIQGWVSSSHVVPDGWLQTITWAGWLWLLLRWLLLPYGLLGLAQMRGEWFRHKRPLTWAAILGLLLLSGSGFLMGWFPPLIKLLLDGSWLLLLTLAFLLVGRATSNRSNRWRIRWAFYGFLVSTMLISFWWWLSTPGILHTLPKNGATDVPRDITIQVNMAPIRWTDALLGISGAGLNVRYADSDEFIQGESAYSYDKFDFKPVEPLRSNAPVIVTVERIGERAYTLNFTTED